MSKYVCKRCGCERDERSCPNCQPRWLYRAGPKGPASPVEPDFRIAPHGSVYMVEPVSAAAQAWVEANLALQDWQWIGNYFAVEPRLAEPLILALQADGMKVEPAP